MREKRVKVHCNAGNNPSKWKGEELEQCLEKLGEGKGWNQEIFLGSKIAHYGTAGTDHIPPRVSSSGSGLFFQAQCCSEMGANSLRLLERLQLWRVTASYSCSQMWWMNASSIRALELPFLPLGKKRMGIASETLRCQAYEDYKCDGNALRKQHNIKYPPFLLQ